MSQQTAAEEYAAATRLAVEAAKGVTDTVRRMHTAIAGRSFGVFGGAGPTKQLHDGISGLVYTGVRAGVTAGGTLATATAQAIGRRRPRGALLDSVAGRTAAGILAGAFGERPHTPPTAMTVRLDGAEVPIERATLAAAYPDASDHLVLFLHGLIETERWWYPRPPRDGTPARQDFGTRLVAELDCTPIYLRYHSGRNISASGAELDALLNRLHAEWPREVRAISVVGHSMGGLVARAAVYSATAARSPWLDRLSNLVYLGTPHNGAPLELGAHVLSWTLRRFPETRPLGELLELRSEAIKDLRFGYLHEEQWSRRDADRLLDRVVHESPPVPSRVRQHSYTVTLARKRNGPLARFLGDLLVTPASSEAVLDAASRHWSGGLHHFHLLSHDEVYARLREWLREGP